MGITLIRIFNKLYPINYKNDKLFEEIINEVKLRNYELDCNTAGLRKQYCGEKYPSGDLYDLAIKNNIQMVYDSTHKKLRMLGSTSNNIIGGRDMRIKHKVKKIIAVAMIFVMGYISLWMYRYKCFWKQKNKIIIFCRKIFLQRLKFK